MSSTEDLFEEEKAELDDEWHEAFDTLVGQGKSPSGIKATIEYVTTQKTKSEVAKEFDTSEVTIRNLQSVVVVLGPIDNPRNQHLGMLKVDYCAQIAERLGWTDGVEYKVKENTATGSKQPRLLKDGWKSLFEEVCGR